MNASDVSERKNERESTPSKVVASPPLEVRQLPLGIWKQPALKAMPLLKVDVAPDVNCNAPPLITIPEEVALNPGAIKPEYKVEVPDWKFPTDWTERIDPGVVVPIPTFTAKLIMSPDCPKVKVFPPCPWIVEDSSKIKLEACPTSPIYTSPDPPPPIMTDSLPIVVSIRKRGAAVVEVAIVQANGELFTTVEVAAFK